MSDVQVIAPEGPIDVSRALELRDLLGPAVAEPGSRVLVDLSRVTLVDSSSRSSAAARMRPPRGIASPASPFGKPQPSHHSW